jgi:hypothetical protein
MKGWIAVTVHASGLEGWCNVSRITFVGPYRDSDGIKGSWVTVNGNDFLVNESVAEVMAKIEEATK